jgi:uncharacterized YccA/Bax inhibitor family protein
MKSNNPVFNRSPEFNGRGGAAYPSYGQNPVSDPSTWGTGTPTHTVPGASTGRMTIDSVVQKTGIALFVVVVAALATWVLTPDLDAVDPAPLIAAITLGGGAAFVLSLVNSFKRQISPALVVAFCVAEGVSLGALSKIFNGMYPGVVVNAVLGTFAAFGGTLAAYKFFDIKVGDKFRKGVMAAMFGMVGLSLLEVVLSAFGHSTGLFGMGGLGLVSAIVGLVLGVFMLILDFDFVENGVAAGLPERESWRAAFAMTVSLVWIYTNLLRILSILQQD